MGLCFYDRGGAVGGDGVGNAVVGLSLVVQGAGGWWLVVGIEVGHKMGQGLDGGEKGARQTAEEERLGHVCGGVDAVGCAQVFGAERWGRREGMHAPGRRQARRIVN